MPAQYRALSETPPTHLLLQSQQKKQQREHFSSIVSHLQQNEPSDLLHRSSPLPSSSPVTSAQLDPVCSDLRVPLPPCTAVDLLQGPEVSWLQSCDLLR